MNLSKWLFGISLIMAFAFITALFILGFLRVQSQPVINTHTNGTLIGLAGNATTTKTLTLSPTEVSRHNSDVDCWMVIDGKVYDLTSYTVRHPGGVEFILMDCGKDGSRDYATKAGSGRDHSSQARATLPQYYIGDLNQKIAAENLQKISTSSQNISLQRPRADDEWENDSIRKLICQTKA